MLAELLATDGVTEHLELGARVGFMALHGGLEANTWEIAAEAARRTGASLYGVVQPPELTWHVPSRHYSPAASPALAAFCDHVEVVISVHGYGGVRDHPRRWLTICLGGRGRAEAGVVAAALRSRLDDHGYEVLDDLDAVPPAYRGLHPNNPVNLVRGAGVQIELPPRVRGISPIWSEHPFDVEPWVPHTVALLDGLVTAAQQIEAAIGRADPTGPGRGAAQ